MAFDDAELISSFTPFSYTKPLNTEKLHAESTSKAFFQRLFCQ